MTLIEMIVAAGISLAVLGMTVPFLTSSMRNEPEVSGKALNINEGRVAMERILRDIRQGTEITTATSSQLSLQTYTRHSSCGSTAMLPSASAPIECQVTYTCSAGACTRVEANPGVTTGTGVRLVDGLGSTSVFTYTPPSGTALHAAVRFVIPDPDGAGNLTLEDGASLRNALLTG
jgi:Tfp pilus assembly protein PilW